MEKIALSKFIARSYNIQGSDLKKMTHEMVKSLFPDLKRTSFEYLEKNPSLMAQGEIVLVEDARGKVIPYFAPEIDYTIEDVEEVSINFDKAKVEKFKDVEDMTNYELKMAAKKTTNIGTLRKVKKELEKRDLKKSKEYNIKKAKERVEARFADYKEEKSYGKF